MTDHNTHYGVIPGTGATVRGPRFRPDQLCSADRHLRLDFARRLICPQRLEGRLADHAIAGPAGKFDFRDKDRLDPMHRSLLARRIGAMERIGVGLPRLDAGKYTRNGIASESRSHATDIDEVRAPIDPRKQGAEMPAGFAPAADDDFLAAAAFGFCPALAFAGCIRRVEPFGHDAF